MTLKHVYHFIFLLTLILIGCGASDKGKVKTELPKTEYSLKLGDSIIQVDSVSAEVWYEEQINKNVITFKVYCTSGYPITDESIKKKGGWMLILAQCAAERGKHYIQDTGDDWINDLQYEFPLVTSMSSRGVKTSITITSFDKKNKRFSCEFQIGEYTSLKEKLENINSKEKIDKRAVVFKGKNIPFKRFD